MCGGILVTQIERAVLTQQSPSAPVSWPICLPQLAIPLSRVEGGEGGDTKECLPVHTAIKDGRPRVSERGKERTGGTTVAARLGDEWAPCVYDWGQTLSPPPVQADIAMAKGRTPMQLAI